MTPKRGPRGPWTYKLVAIFLSLSWLVRARITADFESFQTKMSRYGETCVLNRHRSPYGHIYLRTSKKRVTQHCSVRTARRTERLTIDFMASQSHLPIISHVSFGKQLTWHRRIVSTVKNNTRFILITWSLSSRPTEGGPSLVCFSSLTFHTIIWNLFITALMISRPC